MAMAVGAPDHQYRPGDPRGINVFLSRRYRGTRRGEGRGQAMKMFNMLDLTDVG